MKYYFRIIVLLLAVSLYSCGAGEGDANNSEQALENPNNPNNPNYDEGGATASTDEGAADEDVPPSEMVDLENKGIGPIKNVDIPDEIDQDLAAKGEEVYQQKCTACHNPYKRLVGPPQEGIMEKRTPEWVMNMIMNPEEMLQKDPIAKAMLEEFNGAVMSNQDISEEEARALVEYFRTL